MSSTLGLLEVVSNLPGADMVRVLVGVKVRHGASGRGVGKVGVGTREQGAGPLGGGHWQERPTGRDAGQLGASGDTGSWMIKGRGTGHTGPS